MLRYLRRYAHFVRLSTAKVLEFRLDFFFRVFMDLAYYVIQIGFYKVIFLQTSLLGGWNRDQTLVFMGAYLVVDAISMTFFSNNMWWFPVAVNRGDLDYYLVRPVSSLFFLSLRDFAANSFINLVFALGILAWAVARLPAVPGPGVMALFLAMLMAGAVLHYLLHLLTLLPVFWLHSAGNLHGIFYSLGRCMERPDRIFTGWVRRLLVSAVPFCLMASFPARVFLEGPDWRILAHFILVVAGIFGVILFIWNRGLRAYSSASS
jgi:ABC-2 type transport system permease protein